jgi:hypothetical protein
MTDIPFYDIVYLMITETSLSEISAVSAVSGSKTTPASGGGDAYEATRSVICYCFVHPAADENPP